MALDVLIVGGGRVGGALARLLTDADHRVTVVERRPERLEPLGVTAPAARLLTADGSDPGALEGAGIRTVDVVAAVTGDDACNLVVCGLARLEFAVPRTIARIVDPSHAWLFDGGSGVDIAVDQADLLARLIVEEMSLGEVATLVKLRRGAFALVEERVRAGSGADGRTIADLELPAACVVVAVLRDDDVLPSQGDLLLRADDEVLAVVHEGATARFEQLLGTAATPGADR
jgi:trk system potassium uptake protein